MRSRKKLICAAIPLVVALGGCAQERPLRSFIQPNLIKKSDLEGTWYYTQTVLDSPPTNGQMFIGLSSELIKGRFDVQQRHLYYRRSYEQIGGTEDMRTRDPRGYYGAPIAAWRIDRHFDAIRDYNPVTGEQINTANESEERPWQLREFVRIDWSQNLVTDYVGIGLNLLFAEEDGVSIQPVSYWEADPTNPDGIYMEFQQPPVDAKGNALEGTAKDKAEKAAEFKTDEMVYFDVTNKMVLTPQEMTIRFEEGGQAQQITYPKCFFAYQIDDCASQVVKVRHAFAKISPKHDYVPRLWDGRQMQRFGIWDIGLNRLTYNRQYGITNSGFIHTAARFNIWKQSYPKNPDGTVKLTECKTDDDCGDDQQCGPYYQEEPRPQVLSVCQIHPRAREIRTIPYYGESSLRERKVGKAGEYDVDVYGADLFDTSKEVVRQWNETFKAAYTSATKDRSKAALLDPANVGKQAEREIFVFCHNPVKLQDDDQGPKDPDDCWMHLPPLQTYDKAGKLSPVLDEKGQKVYRVRQGDPRRSTIFWVNQMQASGPLGYGPGLYDPVTGETLSGQAYIYGGAIDTYASRSRDLMLLMVNQITTDAFIKGRDIQGWVNENRNGVANKGQTFTQKELHERALAMDFDWAIGAAPEAKLNPSSVASLKDSLKARAEKMYASGLYGTGQGDPAVARKWRLRNQPIESMLVHPDQLQGLSAKSGPVRWEALSEAEKARISPLRTRIVQELIQKRKEQMAAFGVDFADFFDEGIFQRVLLSDLSKNPELLDRTNSKCGGVPGRSTNFCYDGEALRKYLRREIFLGVTLHEMGHNVGLRHNFRGSYDAMNYFPEYWKLRQQGLSASKDCKGNSFPAAVPGDPFEGKLRPRYINRPGGATSDVECKGGIREYTYSSIMDYGSEFNSDLHGLGSYDKAAIKFSIAEYLEVFTDAKQDKLDDWSAIQSASDSYGFPSPLKPSLELAAITYTQYPDYFNTGTNGFAKRAEVPMELAVNQGRNNPVYGVKKGNTVYPVVPYYFCSDEYAGNLTCQRFDGGSDAYEQAQDVISRYNNYYLINNFKRDRYAFWASASYQSRISGRYFNLLRQQMTWYTLLRSEFEDFLISIARINLGDPNKARQAAAEFFAKEDQWGSFTAAVTMGFDALGDTIARPSYGSFINVPSNDSPDFPGAYFKNFRDQPFGDAGIRNVPLGVGRHENTTWDFDTCGYFWYDQCTTRIGYFIDKRIALETLTESQAYFTGRDTATDVRKYAIGYFRLFPAQVQDKLGALISGDYHGYTNRFEGTQTGLYSTLAARSWTTNRFMSNGVAVTAPPTESSVDPSTGFTLQIEAGLDALANIASGFDREVIENTQVFIVGNGEATIGDSALWNTATGTPGAASTDNPDNLRAACDPRLANFQTCLSTKKGWLVFKAFNERIYAARSVPRRDLGAGGEPARLDTGARMIEMLRTLELRYQAAQALPNNNPDKARILAVTETALKKYVANIEVMRSLHKAFGYGPFKTDAPFVY